MRWAFLATGLGLVLAAVAIYKLHTWRIPKRSKEARPRYELSWPTRAMRWVKQPLIAAAGLHSVVDTLWLDPAGPGPIRYAAGLALSLAGLGLLHASLSALGENFAACDEGRLPHERVRSGVYRVLNHPIYVANVGLFAGIAVMDAGPVIAGATLLLVVFYAFSIRDEDRALARLDEGEHAGAGTPRQTGRSRSPAR